MATISNPQPVIATSASRRWFYIGGAFFLMLVGVGLLYRQLSGSTMREQRLEAQRQKAMTELASKPKPNTEAFSAKLATRRQEVEERERRVAAENARTESEASAGPSPASSPPPPTGFPPAASMPPMGKGKGLFPKGAAEIDEEQLAAFELLRQRQQADMARKLLGWEAQSERQESSMLGAAGALAGLGMPASDLTAARARAGGGVSAASLVEAYQRAQAAGSAGASAPGGSEAFRRQVATSAGDKQALTARPGLGRHAVYEGTSFEVAMRVGVSSDVAGPCRAQLVRDVYDSETGTLRLVPAGSTLICTYDAAVVQGQERLLLVFTSLRFPSGAKVDLGAMDGADSVGVVGAPAQVNTRFWRVFSSSILVAFVTRFAERQSDGGGVTINTAGQSGNPAAQVLADVAKKSLERNINIKPELRLVPGDRLTVTVNRDLYLDPAITRVNP